MRRALLLGTMALLVAAPVVDAARRTPALVVVDRAPLVLRGSGFAASERVVVTAMTSSGAQRVVIRAGARGGFRVVLRLGAQPCSAPFAVRAVGARGSVASVTLPTTPCVPPPRD